MEKKATSEPDTRPEQMINPIRMAMGKEISTKPDCRKINAKEEYADDSLINVSNLYLRLFCKAMSKSSRIGNSNLSYNLKTLFEDSQLPLTLKLAIVDHTYLHILLSLGF